ncbi:uncharacterized protein hyls1 [Garra rufa]|uniref:uncharacterized protein hyls1 n=1 Tax=Garra rufa TaxID=137080 RepID=UPI003CCECECB
MESLDFSEEEIQQQLSALGYRNIPKERLREFKRDLDQLVRHEKSKSHSSSEWTSPTSHSSSSKSPPALIKEKVQLNNIGPSCNYGLFDSSSAGQQREIFSSTFNEDYHGDSGMNHHYDSYSRHTVAHRPTRPSTAPNRLETEEAPSEIFHSVLDGSETSSPDREHQVHLKPVIKRKVLRKHQGRSQVCDESTHSEDSDQESEGEDKDYCKKESRANERKPEEDSKDVKESFLLESEKKKRVKKMLQINKLEKEKYPEEYDESEEEEEEERGDEERHLEEEEEEESGDEEKQFEEEEEEESGDEEKELEEEEEESEEEEEETGEEEESEGVDKESEEEEERSPDEKKELCEQQKWNEEDEEELKKNEEEEIGKKFEEEEQNEAEESEEEEKEESEESEEEEDMCEDEKDSEEETESFVSGENSEENEETKVPSDEPEDESDQVSMEKSDEEESLHSESKEKCTGEEKKESLAKKESTGESGKEYSNFSLEKEQDKEEGEDNKGDNVCFRPEDSESTEGKVDGANFFGNKKSISESQGSENGKQRELNNKEEQRYCFTKNNTDQNPDSNEEEERNGNSKEEESQCFLNEYDKEIELGKRDEKEDNERKYVFNNEDLGEKRLGGDEHGNGMEEKKQHYSGEEDEGVSKGGSEEEEERDWFFNEPVEDKEDRDQDRKSWASDDDYVTIASGHSENEDNMIPAREQECDDVQQKEEIKDVYVEDFHESLGSPAASILTSGYGTNRPDSPKDGDPEEVDYRDDCTLGGLEEGNESILDARDYEDDGSLASFRDNRALETSGGQAPAESPDGNQNVNVCSDQSHDGSEDDDFLSQDQQANHHQNPTENDTGTQNGGSGNVSYFIDSWEVEDLRDSLDHPFNLRHRRGRVQRRPEEKQYDDGYDDNKKRRKEKRVGAYTGCLGTVSELEERLDQMRIGASRVHYDSESEDTESYTDRSSSVTEEPPSAFQEYIKGMTRSHSESDIRPRPKSFIRPVFDHPHTRNLKKTDPVAKYLQYKQDWEMFKPPGEKSRRDLHWAIREQLMYQPPPPRPQKTYIPNTYVVPTEKKRSALRWEIRHDLAHGIIPAKISYP